MCCDIVRAISAYRNIWLYSELAWCGDYTGT